MFVIVSKFLISESFWFKKYKKIVYFLTVCKMWEGNKQKIQIKKNIRIPGTI